MGKKSSASKISSSSGLTTEPTTSSSNQSSILKSSFAPSYLQLHLFASVIQSFESQQLRIHDTSTGRLKHQYSTPAGTSITCLDWGCYGATYRERKSSKNKKRKRLDIQDEDVVVAYGTADSEVAMYSPAQGKVVGLLKDAHQRGIKDFKFNPVNHLEAWSIGGDGKLVQWDLQKDQAVRTIFLPDPTTRTLCSPSQNIPQILCASHSPFAVTIEAKDDFRIESFDAFKSAVTTLIRSEHQSKDVDQTFLATDHERYVNLYSCSSKKILRTLIASGGVEYARLYSSQENTGDELLAITTNTGVIDLFWKPFEVPQIVNGDIKSQRKSLTRKADATVKLVEADSSKVQVSIFSACFKGPDLIVATVDSGVNPSFQKVRWQDEGSKELLFGGIKGVPRIKPATTLNSSSINGVKDVRQAHMNEARTVVANGSRAVGTSDVAIEIISSCDEQEGHENETDGEDSSQSGSSLDDGASEGDEQSGSDAEMDDLEQTGEDDPPVGQNNEEPSFGDLLAQEGREAIDVINSLPTAQKALTKVSTPGQGILPSGMSLGTVLAQSLRTNDQSLLETCLHVMDETVIQNTILRLDSSLAANLLIKLAERLADRPGRYGHLLTWVQSTMIAHGGAIAGQPGVAAKLRTLYQVLSERSRILPSILLLKGKLDMMNAQQTFRAQAEAYRSGAMDTQGMLYVEGDEDKWSSDEDLDVAPSTHQIARSKPSKKKALDDLVGDAESSEDEDMPLVNGALDTDEGEEGPSDDEVADHHVNGIVDDEAEEEDSEGQSLESDGEEEEEVDGDSDEEDSEMDSFINDGEISIEENEDDILSDEVDSPPQPQKKRSKHR